MATEQPNAGGTGPAAEIPWIEGVRTQLRRRLNSPRHESYESETGQLTDDGFARRRILELELEHFPYALEGAYSALLRLEQLAREATESFMIEPKPDTNQIRALDPTASNKLSWTVDEYLDVLRRAQNAVCPYVARTFRRSNPQSLARLAKRIADGKARLPPNAEQLISDYWNESGSTVKAYRDLSQHHAVVSSDVRILVPRTGERYFYLLLPSNPATKRSAI